MNQMNPYMPYSKNKRRGYQYYIPQLTSSLPYQPVVHFLVFGGGGLP